MSILLYTVYEKRYMGNDLPKDAVPFYDRLDVGLNDGGMLVLLLDIKTSVNIDEWLAHNEGIPEYKKYVDKVIKLRDRKENISWGKTVFPVLNALYKDKVLDLTSYKDIKMVLRRIKSLSSNNDNFLFIYTFIKQHYERVVRKYDYKRKRIDLLEFVNSHIDQKKEDILNIFETASPEELSADIIVGTTKELELMLMTRQILESKMAFAIEDFLPFKMCTNWEDYFKAFNHFYNGLYFQLKHISEDVKNNYGESKIEEDKYVYEM